jgi:hypothetical protein
MRWASVIAVSGVLVACRNAQSPRPLTSAREQSTRFVKPLLVPI